MSASNTVIVDYGLGNLRSVAAAIAEVGGRPEITADPEVIHRAERIVLPGVGAFGVAARQLETSGIGPAIVSTVARGVPILGICLGMQLLFTRGSEFGWSSGLGLMQGDVLPILDHDEPGGIRDTHIGWRSISILSTQRNHPLFRDMRERATFYFVHSYSAHDVDDRNVLATVSYGRKDLVAAVGGSNVMGTQFHPEKSGADGLRVLRNFLQTSVD